MVAAQLVLITLMIIILKNPCNQPISATIARNPHFLKVHNDVLKAVDDRQTNVMSLFDLSDAFNTVTVDHGILIHQLQSRFGIKAKALQWFPSYFENRLQHVCINGSNSFSTDIVFGVPKSPVLGPFLYLLYTSPLGDVIRRHGMEFHSYADDPQI